MRSTGADNFIVLMCFISSDYSLPSIYPLPKFLCLPEYAAWFRYSSIAGRVELYPFYVRVSLPSIRITTQAQTESILYPKPTTCETTYALI
ncbi:uncharacterized protein H6S33_001957 [Morchella sextelata]|uniref:uncharacterized protein n=1 Tax=Morchella sextelata TaxID=1174677 RepID=UPI001D03ADF9|nr:uncharacterized protein H6S33_001957 [Morchella sextelata]KAH0607905.1 hypothetical protein H6S33_001957 [Morchella sextelata]